MADQSIPNDTLEEIRKRDMTVFLTAMCVEGSGPTQCEKDRHTLLAKVDVLEKENNKLISTSSDKLNRYRRYSNAVQRADPDLDYLFDEYFPDGYKI